MPGSVEELPLQLVEKLRKAFGGDLVSVVLHGSAVTGEHHDKFSDYNVLCVLREITPAQLTAAGPIFRWWREKGNPSPLLLTPDEVRDSTDCFAIEFHDIQEHHRILHGEDPITSLAVDDKFYRAQIEHDLRAKLLRLRQKSAAVLADKEVLLRLLCDSVSTFCVLLRHALIICGAPKPVPARRREVLELAERRFGIAAAPFGTLLDLREDRAKGKDADPEALLGQYLKEIGRIVEIVDRHNLSQETSE